VKKRIPRVLVVHLSPYYEDEIADELRRVATDLGADISVVDEGSIVYL
jgi:hypothetical protein